MMRTDRREEGEVTVIRFLSITVGLLALAAMAEYLVARHATSYLNAVPVRVRPGRKGLP